MHRPAPTSARHRSLLTAAASLALTCGPPVALDSAGPGTDSDTTDTTPPEPGVQANVVRIPYDTATTEVIAPNLWEPVSLSGGHWVGVREFSGDAVGELWLRTAAGTEMLVDHDVFAWTNRFNQSPFYDGLPTHPAQLEDRWAYVVLDESGERRGLWLAQIESQ